MAAHRPGCRPNSVKKVLILGKIASLAARHSSLDTTPSKCPTTVCTAASCWPRMSKSARKFLNSRSGARARCSKSCWLLAISASTALWACSGLISSKGILKPRLRSGLLLSTGLAAWVMPRSIGSRGPGEVKGGSMLALGWMADEPRCPGCQNGIWNLK